MKENETTQSRSRGHGSMEVLLSGEGGLSRWCQKDGWRRCWIVYLPCSHLGYKISIGGHYTLQRSVRFTNQCALLYSFRDSSKPVTVIPRIIRKWNRVRLVCSSAGTRRRRPSSLLLERSLLVLAELSVLAPTVEILNMSIDRRRVLLGSCCWPSENREFGGFCWPMNRMLHADNDWCFFVCL